MDAVFDDAEPRVDAGCLRRAGEADGVVAQRLVGGHVDQERRQLAQVRVDRRDERRARVRVVEV